MKKSELLKSLLKFTKSSDSEMSHVRFDFLNKLSHMAILSMKFHLTFGKKNVFIYKTTAWVFLALFLASPHNQRPAEFS